VSLSLSPFIRFFVKQMASRSILSFGRRLSASTSANATPLVLHRSTLQTRLMMSGAAAARAASSSSSTSSSTSSTALRRAAWPVGSPARCYPNATAVFPFRGTDSLHRVCPRARTHARARRPIALSLLYLMILNDPSIELWRSHVGADLPSEGRRAGGRYRARSPLVVQRRDRSPRGAAARVQRSQGDPRSHGLRRTSLHTIPFQSNPTQRNSNATNQTATRVQSVQLSPRDIIARCRYLDSWLRIQSNPIQQINQSTESNLISICSIITCNS